MKVLIPMDVNNCESDCPFWEDFATENHPHTRRVCNYDWEMAPIPDRGVREDCPLKKFKV
jgi:hypothetical protein